MKPTASALPLVAPTYDGEILGSWMLRVASTYDLSLPSLLNRIGAARQDRRHKRLLWLELGDADTEWDVLSEAVRRRASDLRAMSVTSIPGHVPKELVLCEACLIQSMQDIGSPIWKKDWLHPFASVCTHHRCWLTPIAYSNVRCIHRIDRLVELVMALPVSRRTDFDFPESLMLGALWIHRSLIESLYPPTLCDDLADVSISRLVHKLQTVLNDQIATDARGENYDYCTLDQFFCSRTSNTDDRRVTPERPIQHRERMRHIGLIGAYLMDNVGEQRTDRPAFIATVIKDVRREEAEGKSLEDLIEKIFGLRTSPRHPRR